MVRWIAILLMLITVAALSFMAGKQYASSPAAPSGMGASAPAAEMHAAASTMEASTPEAQKVKAAAEVLKALTEHKAKQISSANGKLDRTMLRYSAKNLAERAELILKTSRKIGG